MIPNMPKKQPEDPKVQAKIDYYKELLQGNSAMSDKWIEAASVLMAKHNLTYEKLAYFSTEQLENILNAYNGGAFTEEQLSTIMDVNLNATQMSVILMGYANGGTVEQLKPYYTNPGMPYIKMNYMVSALVSHGVDMAPYADFDPHQVYEIYAGIVQGLNYKAYAQKEFPAEVMGLIRHALAIDEVDVSCDPNGKLIIDFTPIDDDKPEEVDFYEDPDELPNFVFGEDEDVTVEDTDNAEDS